MHFGFHSAPSWLLGCCHPGELLKAFAASGVTNAQPRSQIRPVRASKFSHEVLWHWELTCSCIVQSCCFFYTGNSISVQIQLLDQAHLNSSSLLLKSWIFLLLLFFFSAAVLAISDSRLGRKYPSQKQGEVVFLMGFPILPQGLPPLEQSASFNK